jgi:hypothetical protein
MSDINYEEVVDGELFKWEKEGTVLEGLLQSYSPRKDTGKGPGHLYEVKTSKGVAAFFAPTLLHKKLAGIKLGSIVKITFTKISKTANGNTLKNFTVGHAKADDATLNALGLSLLKSDDIDPEKEFNDM